MKRRRTGIIKIAPLGLLLVWAGWLVAGATLSVAVAWGLFWQSAFPKTRTLTAIETGRQFENRRMVFQMTTVNPGIVQAGPSAQRTYCYGSGRVFSTDGLHPIRSLGLYVFEAGWPVASVSGEWRFSGPHEELPDERTPVGLLLVGASDQRRPNLPIALPFRPLWPGFAINTLFYAGVLWMLFAGPFALRRMLRRRRGRCPACAYPIGTSEVCTECGAVHSPVKASS